MYFNYLIIFCRSTVGKNPFFHIWSVRACVLATDRKKSSEKILGKNPRTHECWPQAVRSEKILFPIYGMFAHALCRISQTKSSPPSASVCLDVPRCASRGTLFCDSRGTRDRTKSLFPSLDVLNPI